MSFLQLAMGGQGFNLNVTSFSSPISNSVFTVQTKMMAMHFPVKIAQPELQLDVIFRSEVEFENFQRFVRSHQQHVLSSSANLVWLNWPERNIDNWTGVIKKFTAGGQRFNPVPHASFVVSLVDSMVTRRTDLASMGTVDWRAIAGQGMEQWYSSDAMLAPPTAAENALALADYGAPLYGTGGP